MSPGRRRSLAVAATFAVAAIAGVVGGKLTGRVTPALLVFVGLVLVGTLATYWVDRRADASGVALDGKTETGKSASADLRGARGVQVGDQNVQHNYFEADPDG